MSTDALRPAEFNRFEQLRFAQDVLRTEAEALDALASNLPATFFDAVRTVLACRGRVVVSGMGKAGHIGGKISATLASTGTPSLFVHPAEAIHGDLGSIADGDVVIVLSFSGETEEVVRLVSSLKDRSVEIVAITKTDGSALGRAADVVVPLGELREACHLGLAPTTSTTAMLAIGDALALVLSRTRGFAPTDFAQFHPGGSLGRKLATVDDVMRGLESCRVAEDKQSIRRILSEHNDRGRRSGAVMLTDSSGRLTGIFTDSDLVRLLSNRQWDALDEPIANVMTRDPISVRSKTPLPSAIDILEQQRISELPVLDEQGVAVGLVDITDVVGEQRPTDPSQSNRSKSPAPATSLAFIKPSEGSQRK
ncbi:MAG: KpsF/GutQ family sugar-phosphate isomerase [Pirellulaceae bacterium]|jgi:arabinose-5-phosphate isomerase|nr:KpsF/GutQ family sugar-phosphate isomerase [Pirellulaceae bacterium]MDP7015304.1 KpsF/GutQ family sugar-phosphate isomerase [Pirellulaceae bacterium]